MKTNTINKKEIEKFSKIAEEWWNPQGKFKPLHKFNPIRISYIKESVIKNFKLKIKNKPLENIKILDIGCGGGLLSEPMTKLGADVVGMSTVPEVIAARHVDMKVSAIGVVVNHAAGMTDKHITHDETLHFADVASTNLTNLVETYVV